MAKRALTVLDGGMGHQLKAMGVVIEGAVGAQVRMEVQRSISRAPSASLAVEGVLATKHPHHDPRAHSVGRDDRWQRVIYCKDSARYYSTHQARIYTLFACAGTL